MSANSAACWQRKDATHDLRRRIEAAIEQLIALLDQVDDDSDLEPSLCGAIGALHATGPGDDREREGGDDNGLTDHLGAWEQAVSGF